VRITTYKNNASTESMKKIILPGIYVCVYFLFSTPLIAETISIDSKKSLCLAEANNNSVHLQQGLENWINLERRESQQAYEHRINEIEANGGVFDGAMLPELIGLGILHQEQLNHEEAANAFQRALYIIRVNEGLYSTKQLPVIDFLIESNTSRQEWKQVADSYDMMYWLYRRNYADDDPRQLNTLKRLRRWYMESYNKKTGRNLEQLFTSAEDVYEKAIKIMWNCSNGNAQETMCFWHKSCCQDALPLQEVCPLDLKK
jgi:tetratricopeptide (TPR) repeat protein